MFYIVRFTETNIVRQWVPDSGLPTSSTDNVQP